MQTPFPVGPDSKLLTRNPYGLVGNASLLVGKTLSPPGFSRQIGPVIAVRRGVLVTVLKICPNICNCGGVCLCYLVKISCNVVLACFLDLLILLVER